MGLQDFDTLVSQFLEVEKIAAHRPRWRTQTHGDYAEARMAVGVPGSRLFRGHVILAAHRVRMPPKYGFSLIYRSERILGLDVNPARIHRNLLLPAKVGGTHWQCWPNMEAEVDDRVQGFAIWLHEFLRRANVVTKFGVLSPPRGVQLDFFDGK